ncbi:hypothetical protein EI533_28280, partial [Pseudomonas donghuensis]|nr:hypothetical protein [Pseudomonas donghuensis]
ADSSRLFWPFRGRARSHRDSAALKGSTLPVGAGLPAMGRKSGPLFFSDPPHGPARSAPPAAPQSCLILIKQPCLYRSSPKQNVREFCASGAVCLTAVTRDVTWLLLQVA